jgi:hypothetical protein
MNQVKTTPFLPQNPQKKQDYLDTYAKVSNIGQNNQLEQKKLADNIAKYLFWSGRVKEADRLTNCGQNWLPFQCSNGHIIYQKIACGLPYCPTCAKPGSSLNKKRAKRVRDVLLGFPCIGHYVFTLPKDLSERLPSVNQISKLYSLAWRILREFFDAEAAVIVLHFFGDKSKGLHLHLDCSFPVLHTAGEYQFPQIILDEARVEWVNGVNAIFKSTYVEMVGHYNFVATLEQEYHLIDYLTRSTIMPEKFIELPDEQKEYVLRLSKGKIIRYFGKFQGKQKKEFLARYRCVRVIPKPELSLVDQKICPICKEKMQPGKPVFMDDINLSQFERWDDYILIDRQIAAYLREEEKNREPEFESLEDLFWYQEVKTRIAALEGLRKRGGRCL